MLPPVWAQKMLCIIVPSRQTASPEFFSCDRTRRLQGTLRSEDATAVKMNLKNKFAFFQSLSQLFLPTYLVECRRTLPELNS